MPIKVEHVCIAERKSLGTKTVLEFSADLFFGHEERGCEAICLFLFRGPNEVYGCPIDWPISMNNYVCMENYVATFMDASEASVFQRKICFHSN